MRNYIEILLLRSNPNTWRVVNIYIILDWAYLQKPDLCANVAY